MRRGYGFLVLSLTGLCGAVAIPGAQEQPPAEKVFKNITSLKGAKASDVIPSMQFMCASLKVKCEYCHTEDRASDEKEAKNTTRAMIAMQREINAKNFNGRNQVTCATCHAGHTHPINLPPIEGIEVRARRSDAVKADEVLAAYGKAVGADAGHVWPGLKVQGTVFSEGVKSDFEGEFLGGKFKLDTKSAKSDLMQGYDGSIAWFSTPKGIQKVPVQYAIAFINEKEIYAGLDTLPKIATPSGATAKIGDKDQLVVTGQLPDKSRVAMYFDKATNLLTRTVFTYPTILGSIAQVDDFSNYRKINGVMMPMTIGYHATEGDSVLQIRSVRVDGKLDPTSFEPPAK